LRPALSIISLYLSCEVHHELQRVFYLCMLADTCVFIRLLSSRSSIVFLKISESPLTMFEVFLGTVRSAT
jgi:hypothetical protein